VAKTGASIVQNVRAALAQPEPKWPNAHEALMELFIIVDDWCLSAEESNKAVREALNGPARPAAPGNRRVRPAAPQSSVVFSPGSNMGGGYVERATRDIESVLSPSVPWLQQWRRSSRRAAGRRTLRSMMRIYCPDLLGSFEDAVANRADWVTANRTRFTAPRKDSRTRTAELKEMADSMESTLRDLRTTRSALRRLIQESYPLNGG
jgi:hypothetical protein